MEADVVSGGAGSICIQVFVFQIFCISAYLYLYLRWKRMLLSGGAGYICVQVFVFQIFVFEMDADVVIWWCRVQEANRLAGRLSPFVSLHNVKILKC